MAPSSSYLDYLKDLFAPFGDITIRKMFGAAGVYCDGAIFAITGDDGVWLKVDDVTRAEFESAGLEPFKVEFDNGKSGTMSYYNAPEDIFDDNDELTRWTELALGASRRAKKPQKKKTKKKTAKKKAAKRNS